MRVLQVSANLKLNESMQVKKELVSLIPTRRCML